MKQTGYKNLKQKGHLNKLNNKQHEKMIKNEFKLKQKIYNKNGILVSSERRPDEVVKVQWSERINEHTQTLSQKEKGKR